MLLVGRVNSAFLAPLCLLLLLLHGTRWLPQPLTVSLAFQLPQLPLSQTQTQKQTQTQRKAFTSSTSSTGSVGSAGSTTSSRRAVRRRHSQSLSLSKSQSQPVDPYEGQSAYEVLGVAKDATPQQVKAAHRKLVSLWHPDKFYSSAPEKVDEATLRMERINRAYYILQDESRRSRYDQYGEEGVGSSAASEEQLKAQGGPNPFGGFGGFDGGQGMGSVDIGDIFESLFGGATSMGGGGGGGFGGRVRKPNPNAPVPGDDVQAQVKLPFLRAIFGGTEKVRVRRLDECQTCRGSGLKSGVKPGTSTCKNCNGEGMVNNMQRTPFGVISNVQSCPACKGSGENIDDQCKKCHGQGSVSASKEVTVKIPKGIQPGATLRIKGQGNVGRRGGLRGDLYVTIEVEDHEKFRREGSDIYSDEEISYFDAILGKTIKAQSIDGNVEVKVPHGIQPEQKLRLKGKGAHKLNSEQRGDAFITIKVKIPSNPTEKEKELINEIAVLYNIKEKEAEKEKEK